MQLTGDPITKYGPVGWVEEVRALYLRSLSMEVDEFEELLHQALRGERPEHPDLPAYLPFQLETILR